MNEPRITPSPELYPADVLEQLTTGYIDRLAAIWPNERSQLHFGGWESTYYSIHFLNKNQCKLVDK